MLAKQLEETGFSYGELIFDPSKLKGCVFPTIGKGKSWDKTIAEQLAKVDEPKERYIRWFNGAPVTAMSADISIPKGDSFDIENGSVGVDNKGVFSIKGMFADASIPTFKLMGLDITPELCVVWKNCNFSILLGDLISLDSIKEKVAERLSEYEESDVEETQKAILAIKAFWSKVGDTTEIKMLIADYFKNFAVDLKCGILYPPMVTKDTDLASTLDFYTPVEHKRVDEFSLKLRELFMSLKDSMFSNLEAGQYSFIVEYLKKKGHKTEGESTDLNDTDMNKLSDEVSWEVLSSFILYAFTAILADTTKKFFKIERYLSLMSDFFTKMSESMSDADDIIKDAQVLGDGTQNQIPILSIIDASHSLDFISDDRDKVSEVSARLMTYSTKEVVENPGDNIAQYMEDTKQILLMSNGATQEGDSSVVENYLDLIKALHPEYNITTDIAEGMSTDELEALALDLGKTIKTLNAHLMQGSTEEMKKERSQILKSTDLLIDKIDEVISGTGGNIVQIDMYCRRLTNSLQLLRKFLIRVKEGIEN